MRNAVAIIKIKFSDYPVITGVEVGVCTGANAKDMLDNIPNLHLHLVDNACEGFKPEQIGELVRNHPRTTPHFFKYSVEATKDFENDSLDFVYIDADHFYGTVKEDLEAWGPKVKEGGILCGHDYQPIYEPHKVARAVQEYAFKRLSSKLWK